MHRCPVVPTAPKSSARNASSRSAEGVTITALLPPSSNKVRPSRFDTAFATCFPIRVEPVADTSGTRRSSASSAPIVASPVTRLNMAGSMPASRLTCSAIFTHAIAVSGAFSEGFQRVAFPQTTAITLFHDQTATGKLNAEIMPTSPRGCHCSSMR